MINWFKRNWGTVKENQKTGYTHSYSQYGEDQIMLALLYIFNLQEPNFIDIGANDPYVFNNTAALNEHGIYGVNIEPDPVTFKKLESVRVHDTNLNIGISNNASTLKYYRFTDSVYNTFSEQEYQNLLKKPELSPLEPLSLEVNTYNNIVVKYLQGIPPTILFIDTEGLDEIIIESIDFTKYAPQIICIETFSYGLFKKDHELINKIIEKGYTVHADTFINTIFIKNTLLPYPQK